MKDLGSDASHVSIGCGFFQKKLEQCWKKQRKLRAKVKAHEINP
jgi:hypothetical protein